MDLSLELPLKGFQKSGKVVIVVFDGYERSPKDHDHSKRTKGLCGNIKIGLDKASIMTKKRLLDNFHNKAELINLLSITSGGHLTKYWGGEISWDSSSGGSRNLWWGDYQPIWGSGGRCKPLSGVQGRSPWPPN